MTRTWTIIAARDVRASFTWYQSLFGFGSTSPAHDYFGRIVDRDGTVLLCLHAWDTHEHPSLRRPDLAVPGNGLLLFFRVDDFDAALLRAHALCAPFDEEPHVNPNTGTREFSLRDPDGYYVTISAAAAPEHGAGPSEPASPPGITMADTNTRVTIHMVASLDGFIARRDGRVDWMETEDSFEGGTTMSPETVAAFLESIDCYVMGSRTYETALQFEARGMGWAYGDTPTIVLTSRELPRTRDSVEFYAGDLASLVNQRLKPMFRSIWVVGGGQVSAACLRLGLADEVRYSILPVLIGEGISFFDGLDNDVALHLADVQAYRTGMVALRYEVRMSL